MNSHSQKTGDSVLRVLMLSHTCQSRALGQMKPLHIAKDPGIRLHVVVPQRWRNDYDKWINPDEPLQGDFTFEPARVRFPHMGPFKRYLHHYPDLGRIMRRFKPHVIDIWEESWGLVSAHACWVRNRVLPSAKIISETEQNLNKKLPAPFERFRRFSLQNADFVIARNNEAIGVVRDKGYSGPVQVVGNAVDEELFRPMDRPACRAALGFQGFVAGYVGRLVEEKGLMDLVAALEFLPADVHLVFVGNGPMLEPLQQKVAELKKADQVQFIPGKPTSELPQIMNALDALVLPSRTTPAWKEQFGRVIIESHACQTPVIGTTSGAIPDVVGEGGLLVPENNPQAIAGAILAMRADPARTTEMGIAGRAQVEARYTWKKIARQMVDIYRQVAAAERSEHGSANPLQFNMAEPIEQESGVA